MKFLLTLFVLVFSGCSLKVADPPPMQLPPFQVESTYQNAVRNASIAEKNEIARNLIAITPENKQLVWNAGRTKILVVTWKSEDSYECFLKPHTNTSPDEANVVWVSTAPEVQRFCQDYVRNNSSPSKEDIELRLKQYLGLNPTWEYDVFVEMWVSPSDLFRPCVDPEVNDSACQLTFQNPPPAVKGIQNYPYFYKNLYFSDFRSLPGVPWTGLGYTYDWGNPITIEGASEFILSPGTSYQINKVTPTVEYCTPDKER
jgi:hypothetical protein